MSKLTEIEIKVSKRDLTAMRSFVAGEIPYACPFQHKRCSLRVPCVQAFPRIKNTVHRNKISGRIEPDECPCFVYNYKFVVQRVKAIIKYNEKLLHKPL